MSNIIVLLIIQVLILIQKMTVVPNDQFPAIDELDYKIQYLLHFIISLLFFIIHYSVEESRGKFIY